MNLGVIARADRGGLAAQTLDVARHLQPARILVVDLGPAGRGPTEIDKVTGAYQLAEVMVSVTDERCHPTEDEVTRFVAGLDVVWSAETLYHPETARIAADAGCATVLHCNPELVRRDHVPPTAMWLPTSWEAHRVPEAKVVPHPVDTERFRPRAAPERVEELFHLPAPAMLDRNGTDLVLPGLRDFPHPARLTIHGDPRPPRRRRGTWRHPPRVRNVTIEIAAETSDNADLWNRPIDLFLLPRRYGGLSLPLAEAAAQALPIVTLDLEPQNAWCHPAGLIPPIPQRRRAFPGSFDGKGGVIAGGEFAIHKASPQVLSKRLAALADDAGTLREMSDASRRWAEANSWLALKPLWLRELEAVKG